MRAGRRIQVNGVGRRGLRRGSSDPSRPFFAPEFDGVPVADSSAKVESEMAHDGHVESAEVFSETRLVVVEDDVEGPVQSVLDQPMAAHGMSGPFSRQLGGGGEVSRVEAAFVLQSSARDDAHDGCGVWQAQFTGKRRWPSSQPASRLTVTVHSSMRQWALSRSTKLSRQSVRERRRNSARSRL